MKKTKNIRLVLVTTILTSCNRMLTPAAGYTPVPPPLGPTMTVIADTGLTAGPPYDPDRNRPDGYDPNRYDPRCQVDSAYLDHLQLELGLYYQPQPYNYGYRLNGIYRLKNLYNRALYWRNRVFIVRGGFGKTAASTAS